MKYRVGQRVRLLHESGEGVITQLIDRYHVEVDLGDDFPIDMHVEELIAIDRAEGKYLGQGTPATEEAVNSANPLVLGSNLVELSLVVLAKEEDKFELILINPEPVEIAYTCFARYKNTYQGLRVGTLNSSEYHSLAIFDKKEVDSLKGMYFQVLNFKPGKGHPHNPFVRELEWNKGKLNSPSKAIAPLNANGWIFNLREDPLAKELNKIPESEYIRVRETEAPVYRPEPEIDLHIEALVPNAFSLAPSEILSIQQKRIDKAISDSLIQKYASMVLIHGVGEGHLRKKVIASIRKAEHVLSYHPADPTRYGNGATKVIFK